MLRDKQAQQGFSLIEVAIVLVIIGVLLAGVTGPLSTWRDHETYKQTELYLEQSRKALLTFAAVKGHLPCPDTDGDGDEDRSTAAGRTCDESEGTLPWLDLGLTRETPWQQPAFYAVHGRVDNHDCDTTNEAECFFDDSTKYNLATKAGDTGQLHVNDAEQSVAGVTELVSQALVVVASFGRNSAETFNDCPGGSDSDDERENCDGDVNFAHTSPRIAAGNRYDDQLIWLDKLSLHGLLLAN